MLEQVVAVYTNLYSLAVIPLQKQAGHGPPRNTLVSHALLLLLLLILLRPNGLPVVYELMSIHELMSV